MKKRTKRFAAAAAAVQMAVLTSISAFPSYASNGYEKSATYYSDDWVINFWNSESSRMDEELAQIAADGFNSIILVVPWNEFQPDMNPCRYEEYPMEKFHKVMNAAGQHGLDVYLRVGYTWDYSEGGNGTQRYQDLLYDETTKAAWLDYVKTIYEAGKAHSNFAGGFLTWEDFWNFVSAAGSMKDTEERIKMAEKIGYQAYVQQKCTLEELQQQYGVTVESYERLPLPETGATDFLLFFQFYDDFLNQLLLQSQSVFPNLSMEVRLDVDPISALGGGYIGAGHEVTFPCQNASYTAAMYSVTMGQESNTEITAAQALSAMEANLARAGSFNNGKPFYLEQLLFTDNTPQFDYNAKLMANEMAGFITGMEPILKARTMGYGIWAYRNYGSNALFNSQFGLGEKGWDFSEGSSVVERNGTNMARLTAKSSISQNFGGRLGNNGSVKVRFHGESSEPRQIWVHLGSETKYVNIDGSQDYFLEFAGRDNQITFSADGTVYVDNVNVYDFETDGKLYSMEGTELEMIGAVRQLNGSL